MRHRTTRTIRSLVAVAGVVSMALVSLSAVSSPAFGAMAVKRDAVVLVPHGTFIGQPLTVTNVMVDGDVVTFDASAGDQWSGDLTGTTTYRGHGTLDLTTGESRVVVYETFTGTVAGIGTGEMHSIDYIQSGPDNLGQADCVVIGGTGGLAGIHGALQFRTTQLVDPDPFGNGTNDGVYTGFLFR